VCNHLSPMSHWGVCMSVHRRAHARKELTPPSKKYPDKESEILYNLVKESYGGRLTAAELEEVKKDVQAIVETSKALREIRLHNSDEPFVIFRPYRRRK
jgi:hypothetical protein